MRVLLFGNPATGHLVPLLPLARAFRERGDTVGVCSAGPMSSLLDAEGIAFLPAGPMAEATVAEVLRTTGHDLWQGLTVEAEAEFFAAARIDLGLDEVLTAARDWRPDLIVAEHFDFVGQLVGALLDVPVAALAYGPAVQPASVEPIAARLRGRYEARGLVHGPARWYLDTCPPALQNPGWVAPAGRIGLRPEPHRSPGPELPAARPEPGRTRPRVLVSFGTTGTLPTVIGPLLRELLDLDVDIRVTLHTSAPEEFGVRPDQASRVEFVGFTPLAELLRGVDALVTHGGAGTVLGALARGLPMVVVPLGADQPVQAERVAASGAGISFPLAGAPAAAVAGAMAEILADTAYRDRAQQVAAEIAALGTPADVAEHLANAVARDRAEEPSR
ncbi:glycosyltransferase [Streptomyces sp. NPDC059979]|uniref:glycosyltransferase n=1 Tax=unclassified Streptomyces TaxID=2593676 RepID=UPI00365FE935